MSPRICEEAEDIDLKSMPLPLLASLKILTYSTTQTRTLKLAHEEKHGKEKVRKWRLALFEAANLAGWEIKQGEFRHFSECEDEKGGVHLRESSVAFCEPGIREFLLPGEEVPKWFHHYTDGHLTEFWVRKRFPALDVGIVFSDLDDEGFPLEFLLLRVNDKVSTIVIDKDYVVSNLLVDHMFLYQLRRKLIEDELQKLLLPDHWNHVEVSGFKDRAIKSIGVHVYKQENTMDNNILFSRPFSLKRTCHDLYDSNNDMGLGCHPLIKKRVSSLGIKNNNISAWLSMCPSWQAHPLSYVNDGDSNSVALASTDDASMQTSSKKQPSKIETEIRLASFQPTIDPPGYIAVPVVEENREEVGLSDNQESFSPPNLETNEVTVNTSMDFEGITKMIEEDPMNAIERLLTGKVSVSLKMQQQSSAQLGLPEVQIPSFEALQKELKNLLTKFDLSSLISDDFHRSTICFYIEGLEKFEFLQPAHRTFIQNFRNFFINAASNYNKLNEVTNKKIRLKVERKVVLNKLQEARAKDERKTSLISSASLRVKEIVSSIEDIEAQLVKLKHEKEAFELAINECGKQKERLRTDCISWAHQSRDLVVELTKTEEIAQFLEYQVEMDETNFQKLVASIPF
ncbi:hypothetical protein VNO77_33978 [Canavalia gladiata]|uniref:Uncharacterized protein n=1 Tax=Canavalia gladiata TaxID=3824 RepID=A0AAN9KFG7_CANGL